jgi:hypothetical protein
MCTGYSFNDFNYCDLTTMLGEFALNENSGQVNGIDQSNPFGSYIVYIYKYIPIHMNIIEYT